MAANSASIVECSGSAAAAAAAEASTAEKDVPETEHPSLPVLLA
jgi:hypothetical protein